MIGGEALGAPRPTSADLPEAAWWVALASLPGMGPARLRLLWDALAGPEAWDLLSSGRGIGWRPLVEALGSRAERQVEAWAAAARGFDVAAAWHAHRDVGVHVLGDAAVPRRFADDPEPPVTLFSSGALEVLDGPTVAIVGTRRCTRPGAEIAFELGRECARAGVRVVSGLAIGIDAAAHSGALSAGEGAAPPVAVVGTGLDVIYPRRSRQLWAEVARRGLVLTEHPLGTGPARWRFPARNRLLAALGDATVVVESPASGGSLHTVDEALERGRRVLAVPGSIRSAASAGSNAVLADGAIPACSADDVLVAVGVAPPRPARSRRADDRPEPSGDASRVLVAIGWEPATFDQISSRTDLGPGAIAVAVERLEADRWIDRCGGRIERRAGP